MYKFSPYMYILGALLLYLIGITTQYMYHTRHHVNKNIDDSITINLRGANGVWSTGPVGRGGSSKFVT